MRGVDGQRRMAGGSDPSATGDRAAAGECAGVSRPLAPNERGLTAFVQGKIYDAMPLFHGATRIARQVVTDGGSKGGSFARRGGASCND